MAQVEKKVGQVWEDCDPRREELQKLPRRRVRVFEIRGANVEDLETGRKSKIDLGGLRHPKGAAARSGYRLVEDAPST